MGDRQLNSLWYHHLRLDDQFNVSDGRVWEYEYTGSLAAAGTDVIAFLTANAPVGVMAVHASTSGARGIALDFYGASTVGGGIAVPGFPLNHHISKPSPVESVESGNVVLDGGAQIASRLLGDTLVGGDFVPFSVLAPSTQYHVEIENLHNQTAEVTLVMAFAGLIGVL